MLLLAARAHFILVDVEVDGEDDFVPALSADTASLTGSSSTHEETGERADTFDVDIDIDKELAKQYEIDQALRVNFFPLFYCSFTFQHLTTVVL